MGLAAIYRRPRTSKPAPGHKIHPYLLRGMEITRPNQVWAADITYIPMAKGFLYLVAIMDWSSRCVFCVEALREALSRGKPEVFNTDQGGQFTGEAFTGLLEQHGVKISMDGKGRYSDNIFVERLWRSVKYEEVYLKAYSGGREAQAGIDAYFHFYNTQRPHQALGYRTPAEVFNGDSVETTGHMKETDAHLMKPNEDNPSRYWEHQLITDLNDEILSRLGGSWHEAPAFSQGWTNAPELADIRNRAQTLIEEEFATEKLWGWKDPRTCLTLPFWQGLLPPMQYVICLRNPIDVARSLERRNSFSLETGVNLWSTHVKSALEHSAGQPRIFVFYEDFIGDCQGESKRLSRFLGEPKLTEQPDVQTAIQEFIEEELQHHRASIVDAIADPELALPAKSLYMVLRAYVGSDQQSNSANRGANQIMERALDSFSRYCVPTQADFMIGRLAADLQEKDDLIEVRESQIDEIIDHLGGKGDLIKARDSQIAELSAHQEEKDDLIEARESQIAELSAHLGEKGDLIEAREIQIAELTGQLAANTGLVQEGERRIANLNLQLTTMQQTPGWRALQFLRRMVVPPNSFRLRLYWAILAGIRGRRRLLTIYNLRMFGRYRTQFGTKAVINAAISKVTPEQGVKPLSVAQIDLLSFGETPPMIDTKVSVVIPTLNAGGYMSPLLARLNSQYGVKDCELIVVDSGSSDDTVGVARLGGATVVEIPPEDFTHAYSRNKGADLATGNYLLFMTQDAVPLTGRWLWEMVTAIKKNDIVAVSCGEYPRSNVDLFHRVMSWHHRQVLDLNVDRVLGWDESCASFIGLRANAQLNNVAMLINRDIFEKYRFIPPYAEDLELGIRLIKDGHKLGYLSSTHVLHSHTRTPYYYLKRTYVDTKALDGLIEGPRPRIAQNHEKLYHDIVTLFFVINDISRSLTELPCPMSLDGLFTATKGYLRVCGGSPVQFFLDEGLGGFIHSLTGISEQERPLCNSAENSLLPPLEHDLELVERYMSTVYGVVDEQILQEFIAALYKIFASKCGDQLALLYLSSNGNHKEMSFLSNLNQELTKGI